MPVLSSTPNHISLKHGCPDYFYVKFRYIYLSHLPSTMSGQASFWSIWLPRLGVFEVHCSWWPNFFREELARFHLSHIIKKKEEVNLAFCVALCKWIWFLSDFKGPIPEVWHSDQSCTFRGSLLAQIVVLHFEPDSHTNVYKFSFLFPIGYSRWWFIADL